MSNRNPRLCTSGGRHLARNGAELKLKHAFYHLAPDVHRLRMGSVEWKGVVSAMHLLFNTWRKFAPVKRPLKWPEKSNG